MYKYVKICDGSCGCCCGGHLCPVTEEEYKSYLESIQPERLSPEETKFIYWCLEMDKSGVAFNKIFETSSKEEASKWKNQKPTIRTWHEKVCLSDSPNNANK